MMWVGIALVVIMIVVVLYGRLKGDNTIKYTSRNDETYDQTGSVKHQKDLFGRLGYDWRNYDPGNKQEVSRVAKIAINAQIRGTDSKGRMLSHKDLDLLHRITGR